MLAIPMSIAHAEPVPAPKKIARQKSKVSKAKPKAKPVSNPASKLTPISSAENPHTRSRRTSQMPPKPASAVPRGQCHATGAVGAARNDECVWIYGFTGAGVTVYFHM